ncbi:hypothetical protein BDP27DRAFT_1336427, partial [Rhodocollybia butyracea]
MSKPTLPRSRPRLSAITGRIDLGHPTCTSLIYPTSPECLIIPSATRRGRPIVMIQSPSPNPTISEPAYILPTPCDSGL